MACSLTKILWSGQTNRSFTSFSRVSCMTCCFTARAETGAAELQSSGNPRLAGGCMDRRQASTVCTKMLCNP